MPRAGEPRVTIRLGEADHAVLSAAAEKAGVALGALIRVAAVRYAAELAGEAAAGRVRLRRASGASSEVPGLARLAEGAHVVEDPSVVPVLDAVAPGGERGKVSRPVVPVEGVSRADAFRRALERK